MMRTRLIRQPGQPGTKKLVEQYGLELVCVRYRYDDQRGKRYKTVELIVEESPYSPSLPKLKPKTIVGVRIGLNESGLQRKLNKPVALGTAADNVGKFDMAVLWNLGWRSESHPKSDLLIDRLLNPLGDLPIDRCIY